MSKFVVPAVAVCLVAGVWGQGFAVVPWASSVVQYDYDGDGNPANDDATYSHPGSALGEPSRMGGVGTPYASVVSMFNGPWTGSEIVGVAPGGQLVVTFDQPISDDPSHLYGKDLIVFGNSFFWTAWPDPQITSPAAVFDHPAQISLSADGVDWRVVPNVYADSLFPTQAYMGGGPYDVTAGQCPSDFRKPMNPALTLTDFNGLSYAQALALYDGSGGGTAVDMAAVGLSEVRYVKITVPEGSLDTVYIDGFAVVPEPVSLALLACAAAGMVVRRRR